MNFENYGSAEELNILCQMIFLTTKDILRHASYANGSYFGEIRCNVCPQSAYTTTAIEFSNRTDDSGTLELKMHYVDIRTNVQPRTEIVSELVSIKPNENIFITISKWALRHQSLIQAGDDIGSKTVMNMARGEDLMDVSNYDKYFYTNGNERLAQVNGAITEFYDWFINWSEKGVYVRPKEVEREQPLMIYLEVEETRKLILNFWNDSVDEYLQRHPKTFPALVLSNMMAVSAQLGVGKDYIFDFAGLNVEIPILKKLMPKLSLNFGEVRWF